MKKFASNLDSLPIRVKTRFNGKNGDPRRRVVSTPIFDLVTPMEDLGLIPPPKFSEKISDSADQGLKVPKRRPPRDHYPTAINATSTTTNKHKSLPLSSPLQKNPVMYHHHEERPVTKRDVSMPLLQQNQSLHKINDYTNIIQIYEDNSPFGLYQRQVSDPIPSTIHSNLSSPEVNSNSSDSDNVSNPSSCYSFIDSPEDDIISVEPSIIQKHTNENPSNFKSSLHPRDSIKYLRNYDDAQKGFQIKTKTPPVLPQHTINITRKDQYYKSRAGFNGESQNSPIQRSPCNERDTAIFTRRSRRLPPIPSEEDPIPARAHHSQSPQPPAPFMFHQFQSPGYTGGLRVVNRVPS